MAANRYGQFLMQVKVPYKGCKVVYDVWGDTLDYFAYLNEEDTENLRELALPHQLDFYKWNDRVHFSPEEWRGLCKLVLENIEEELSLRGITWKNRSSH